MVDASFLVAADAQTIGTHGAGRNIPNDRAGLEPATKGLAI
jgi:hypothetical protein